MIDSGSHPGHHQPLLDIPPPDISTIYSGVRVQGGRPQYRDFSASRQEVRARFHQRLLLKQRVEAARKTREQATPAQTADPVRPIASPPETDSGAAEAIQDAAQVPETLSPKESDERIETREPDAVVNGGAARAPAEAEAPRRRKAGSGSRWFALRSVFAGDTEARTGVEARTSMRSPRRPLPVLAVFSQAGGVGKTSLAATLGRVLAARGEQTFLAETASPGLLPLFFGSREVKPGMVRTFSPPAGSGDAAVKALALDPRQFLEKRDTPDLLVETLLRHARGSSRILIDIQTGSMAVAHRLLPLISMVLVPLLADMNSVMSLNAVEAIFSSREGAGRGEPGEHAIEPVYLLNEFDGSLPLHAEVRELLREQLGARLLPFVVRRSSAVSEALAEGMTVVDYAPDSSATGDYVRLANWLASVAPLAVSGFSGLRWREQ